MKRPLRLIGIELAVILLLAAVLALWLFTPVFAAECGIASRYGRESCRPGRPCRTAHGEPFPTSAPTAAHRSLPFGTIVRVAMPSGGCTVRINDRGPFVRGRIIDLSPAAARACGLKGLARVCITPVR